MKVDDLLRKPGAWLKRGSRDDVVVSSRVRLARNLAERLFPEWAGEDERRRIWDEVSGVICGLPQLHGGLCVETSEIDEVSRRFLFERHLISRELIRKRRGSGLVVRGDETLAVMINEEDHLRLQSMRPGLSLGRTLSMVNALDDAVAAEFTYAFSRRLGYLTACPSNVGTGMRASVMLHLPGLVLMNEVEPIVRGLTKIGLAVRGLWGEGTEISGNMLQVSNQVTLGVKEDEIAVNLEQVIMEVVEHEHNARLRLMEQRGEVLRDHVGRAYGILSNAHLVSTGEALDLLSGLRLGVDLGILKDIRRETIDELMVLTQPGHLQKLAGRRLKARERDRVRADLIRRRLKAGEDKGAGG